MLYRKSLAKEINCEYLCSFRTATSLTKWLVYLFREWLHGPMQPDFILWTLAVAFYSCSEFRKLKSPSDRMLPFLEVLTSNCSKRKFACLEKPTFYMIAWGCKVILAIIFKLMLVHPFAVDRMLFSLRH